MPLCSAHNKDGSLCQNNKAMANGKCRMHGGKALAGIAAPNWIHGRYSKVLPTRMLERFLASMTGPELVATRSELALIDCRTHDLLEKVADGESGEMWRHLVRMTTEHDKVNEEDRPGKLAEIWYAIRRGADEYQTWTEIRGLIETRLRCVDREQARVEKMGQMIRSDDALAMIERIAVLVREHVKDRDALRVFADEFRKLM